MSVKKASSIAVVGGGLGGLTLARILQIRGLDVTVYERETSRDARPQGGVLDMHQEAGLWALQECSLEKEFRASALLEGGQDLRILNRAGVALYDEAGEPELDGRPEIDRAALRNLLLDSLRSGTVKWDSHIQSIAAKSGGGYTLTLGQGESVAADVLVGADGARSRVRALLTDARPSYSGVTFIEFHLRHVDQRHPLAAKTAGLGSLFALDDNKGILTHRTGGGHLHGYAVLRIPEAGLKALGVSFDKPVAELRAALVAQFKGWSPTLTDLLQHSDDDFLARPITALPIGVRWQSRADVTLIGDAAHLMSPFAGEGANLAMQDGAELALALIEKPAAAAIAAYEVAMFERGEEAARMSASGLDTCISANGAEQMTAMMKSFGPQAT